jgi:hypothetical protein
MFPIGLLYLWFHVQASARPASNGAVNGTFRGGGFCLANLFCFEANRNSFRWLDPWFHVQACAHRAASKGVVNGTFRGGWFCLANLFCFEANRNSFRLLDPWFLCRLVLGEQLRKVPLAAPTRVGGFCLVNFFAYWPRCLLQGCWIFGFMCRPLNPYQHRRVPLAAPSRGGGFCHVNLFCLRAWMFTSGLLYLWFHVQACARRAASKRAVNGTFKGGLKFYVFCDDFGHLGFIFCSVFQLRVCRLLLQLQPPKGAYTSTLKWGFILCVLSTFRAYRFHLLFWFSIGCVQVVTSTTGTEGCLQLHPHIGFFFFTFELCLGLPMLVTNKHKFLYILECSTLLMFFVLCSAAYGCGIKAEASRLGY